MSLPQGSTVRGTTAEDVPAVAALLLADDPGGSVYDEHFVRDQWSIPGFDPERDAWIVETSDGTPVGAAHSFLDEPSLVRSWGVVHPDHRGRGIGSSLLDRIEARAKERLAGIADAEVHHSIADADEAARAMVMARGFHLVRSFRHMQIELAGRVDTGEPPPGVTIRTLDVDRDLPEVHSVLARAFVDEWGWDVPPFERWLDEDLRAPGSDPSLWLVATAADRVVGASTALLRGNRGWIPTLGVDQAWRGKGIGTALLRHSFAMFADRGLPHAMLNVDFENPTGAMALYEKAGMRIVHGFDVYEKPIG